MPQGAGDIQACSVRADNATGRQAVAQAGLTLKVWTCGKTRQVILRQVQDGFTSSRCLLRTSSENHYTILGWLQGKMQR